MGFTGPHQRSNLIGRQVPVAQPCQARLGKLLHAVERAATGLRHRLHALHGDDIFTLRRHELRAVDLEQRLAFADGLASDIDMQPFDIALELRRDGVHAALVDLDPAGDTHRFAQQPQACDFSAHTQLLDLLGADPDLLRATGAAVGSFVFALVDSDVVHPRRIFFRRRRGIGQAHGIAVIQQLARLRCTTGG